jgi:hypothetical protein
MSGWLVDTIGTLMISLGLGVLAALIIYWSWRD